MRKILVLSFMVLLNSCTKDNKVFRLKLLRLNECRRAGLPVQQLYLKVVEDNTSEALTHTDHYPSSLSLPATLAVHPEVPMLLYSKAYQVQLWGAVTGYIAGCRVDMEDYRIIFPIEMELKQDSLSISLMGSWK